VFRKSCSFFCFALLDIFTFIPYAWRALVGGDWAGYYDPTRVFTSLISPQEIIYDLALIFAGGNIYAGFYLGLFISAFLTCLSIFYLSKSLLRAI